MVFEFLLERFGFVLVSFFIRSSLIWFVFKHLTRYLLRMRQMKQTLLPCTKLHSAPVRPKPGTRARNHGSAPHLPISHPSHRRSPAPPPRPPPVHCRSPFVSYQRCAFGRRLPTSRSTTLRSGRQQLLWLMSSSAAAQTWAAGSVICGRVI